MSGLSVRVQGHARIDGQQERKVAVQGLEELLREHGEVAPDPRIRVNDCGQRELDLGADEEADISFA